jgi:DNA-binding transcriptional LysR family regulator
MTPTRMGEVFVRRANAVQGELRRVREEIDQMRGQTTGRIAVGLSTVTHLALLPRALAAFRARYPDVVLDITEGLFPQMQSSIEDGLIDFYVGPLPEVQLARDFVIEKLFDNERLIFGRIGHPLADATSLRDLVGAQWITTSITVQSEAELGPVFARHDLPPPRVLMQTHSALTMIVAAACTDLLTMMPRQWRDFTWTGPLLRTINVKETLTAPAMHIVRRTRLPLTPAAEYLCDLLRRASQHQQAEDVASRPRPHKVPRKPLRAKR